MGVGESQLTATGNLHALRRNLCQPSGRQTVWKGPRPGHGGGPQARRSELTGTRSSAPRAPRRAAGRPPKRPVLRTGAAAGSPSASYPRTGRRQGGGGACPWLLRRRAPEGTCSRQRSHSHSTGSCSSGHLRVWRGLGPAAGTPHQSRFGPRMHPQGPQDRPGGGSQGHSWGVGAGREPSPERSPSCCHKGPGSPARAAAPRPGRFKEPAPASPSASRNCSLVPDRSPVSPTARHGNLVHPINKTA